jgi:hypothetical protein
MNFYSCASVIFRVDVKLCVHDGFVCVCVCVCVHNGQCDQKFENKLPNFWKCSQNCSQITKAQIESQK